MSASIFSRKRDLAYLVYFLIHIPVMFFVDLYPIYPTQLIPTFMHSLRNFYITTYKDQFFINPPAFFVAYMWLELLYHLPTSLWSISALRNENPKLPLVLLPYSCQTFLTTFTCMVEYLSWDISLEDKINLSTLYGPYLALSVFMGIDMYTRLSSSLGQVRSAKAVKTITKNQ